MYIYTADDDKTFAAEMAAGDEYNRGYAQGKKDAQPQWISVEDRLPDEFVGSIQTARIIKGITEEERTRMRNGEIEDPHEWCWTASQGHHLVPRSSLYGAADVHGNNEVPYSWKANGWPMSWFGQEVSHWMPLPEAPKEE